MPQRFAFPTKHSQKRAAQRTNRGWDHIQPILDRGLYVDAGKPGFWHKRFLVFFHPDLHPSECFVAVQRESGKVLTVMPQRYGKTFPWITQAMYDKAKRLYERSVQAQEKERVRVEIEAEKRTCELAAQQTPTHTLPSLAATNHVFFISLGFIDQAGEQRTKKLLSIPSAGYDHCIQNLLGDTTFPDQIQVAYDGLKVSPDWVVSRLIIRSKETFTFIALQ